MTKVEWTQEAPEVEGWYWFVNQYGEYKFVSVGRDATGLRVRVSPQQYEGPMPLAIGSWYGWWMPAEIPEPPDMHR